MTKKIILLMTISLLVLSACGTEATPEPAATTEAPTAAVTTTDTATEAPTTTEASLAEGLELTLEELAQYNGKDGNPAYLAVDGVIYDATGSSLWGNGDHNGFEAGNDLTDAIKDKSPHGVGKLKNLVVVGKLVE